MLPGRALPDIEDMGEYVFLAVAANRTTAEVEPDPGMRETLDSAASVTSDMSTHALIGLPLRQHLSFQCVSRWR